MAPKIRFYFNLYFLFINNTTLYLTRVFKYYVKNLSVLILEIKNRKIHFFLKEICRTVLRFSTNLT